MRQRVSQPRIAYAFTDEWDTYASADLLIPTAALEKAPPLLHTKFVMSNRQERTR